MSAGGTGSGDLSTGDLTTGGMRAAWAASPSELLMKAAAKAASRRRSTVRRRLTLIAGLVMLAIAIVAVLLAPLPTVNDSHDPVEAA